MRFQHSTSEKGLVKYLTMTSGRDLSTTDSKQFSLRFFPARSTSTRQRKRNILYTANDFSFETFYGFVAVRRTQIINTCPTWPRFPNIENRNENKRRSEIFLTANFEVIGKVIKHGLLFCPHLCLEFEIFAEYVYLTRRMRNTR